uniref:Myb/SANT-like DNA-binding domain-containing protein n=1 Tax=Bactrocera dorsalis TaxID=27457 RepID=A0A034WXD0_BACDO
MSVEMATKGHVYSANEIRVKIHNLTNKYRDERKSIGPSGGSPSTWEFYPKINSIFGSYKSFNLKTLVEESTVHEVVYCASPLNSSSITQDSQEELPFVDEEPARKEKNILQIIFKMNFWKNSGLQI